MCVFIYAKIKASHPLIKKTARNRMKNTKSLIM